MSAPHRITPSVRRGLRHWAYHCLAIFDDKQAEFEEAQEQGETTEYDKDDLDDMQAAIGFMLEQYNHPACK
jgi:hypothetical protein